jgi:hypothetical protein
MKMISEMADLENILDSFGAVDAADVFSAPLQEHAQTITESAIPINTADFEPAAQESPSGHFHIEEEPIEEEPYDAQQNAESLVYGLNALTAPLLTTASYLKLQQLSGGREFKKLVREAERNELMGKELSERDKKLLKSRDIFNKKLDQLSEACLASDKKIERQIRAAKPWCKKKRINVPEGLAFWGEFVSDQVESITKILML